MATKITPKPTKAKAAKSYRRTLKMWSVKRGAAAHCAHKRVESRFPMIPLLGVEILVHRDSRHCAWNKIG
jgi:hypothetical protein